MPETPRRLLFVVHGFPPEFRGGTELYVLRLAHALNERGHHVAIFTGSMENRPRCETEKTEQEGLTIWRVRRQGLFLDNWDKSWCPEVETELAEVVRAERPDVVHVHHWIRLTRTLVATLHRLGVPTVATLHDLWTSCARCFRVRDETLCQERMSAEQCFSCVPHEPWQSEREVREELALFHADFQRELALAGTVVVPSTAQQEMIARQMNMAAERLTVLAHGCISDLTRQRHQPAAKIRLGHWGHLYPMKGFHLILEALQRLPAAWRERFSLDCWGRAFDSAYKARLDRLAEGLDIRWHGPYVPTDLQDAQLDWAVLPSMAFESWSFVLDEAFSLGLPVIASDRGALGSRVGKAGLMFAAEDASALAAVLERVATEPELWTRAAAAVPMLPSMSEHAHALETIYARVQAAAAVVDTAGPELDSRHRLHRSLMLEERQREVLLQRGRVQQEFDRAEGLKNELARSDAAVSGHTALEVDLHDSLKRFERELAAARADYKQLIADHAELRRAKDGVIADYEGSVSEYREALENERAEHRRVADELARMSAGGSAHGADADALAAAHATLQAHAEGLARLNESVGELNAKLVTAEVREGELAVKAQEREAESRRLAAVLEQVESELVADRHVRATVETALAASREAEADMQRKLVESEAAVRRHLQEANQARKSHTEERAAAADKLRAALATGERQETVLRGLLDERQSILSQREEELIALKARAAGMAATLAEAERVGGAVATDLAGLGQALGLGVPDGAAGFAVLPELTRGVAAAVIQARNFLGELDASVQRLTEEARIIEAERSELESRLRAREAEQDRLRRSLVYRAAERWAGARKSVSVAQEKRKGDGLRILMVIHDFLPRHAAGSEIYTFNILQALKRRGHAVHLLTTEAHQGVHSYNVRETAVEGIAVTEVSHQHTTRYFDLTWRDARMNRIFRETLERLKPDVVHVQHLYHHSVDYPAIAAEAGIPVVYTLHEYMLLCPRGGQMLRADGERCLTPRPEKCADCIAHLSLDSVEEDATTPRLASRISRHVPSGMRQTLRGLLGERPAEELPAVEEPDARAAAIRRRLEAVHVMARSVDLFISPSEFLRQRFIESGVVAPERIIFSDNGQESAAFNGVSRRASATLRVGYIGTIADYKGLHVLTGAMDLLAERTDIRCDIHGGLTTAPSYAEGLRAHAQNPRTRFHGRYASDALPEILADMDVLVVPSLWWENSPLTIHEAFMAGLPVIASDIGGMAEFVRDGSNGLLFRVGDAADLAAKITRFAEDRALLELLRNKVVPIRSIEEDALGTEARYREVIARKKGSAVP